MNRSTARLTTLLLLVFMVWLPTVRAQGAGPGAPSTAAHREAMAKLGFLAGTWTGAATVSLGPGRQLSVTQTERVEYKLDGTILLVEGTGRDQAGAVVFSALATIGFDAKTGSYRIRAHRDGNYVEAELKLLDRGFEWGFSSGPVSVTNRMNIDSEGRWSETTDASMPDGRQFRSVDMLLRRQ